MTNIVDFKTSEKDLSQDRKIKKIVDRLTIGDLSSKAVIKVSFGFENFILYGHAGTLISWSGLFRDLSDVIVANVEDKSWNLRIASNMYLSQYHDVLSKLWKNMHIGKDFPFLPWDNVYQLLNFWDIAKLLRLFDGIKGDILIDQFYDEMHSAIDRSPREQNFLARNQLRKMAEELSQLTRHDFGEILRSINQIEDLAKGKRFIEGELFPLNTYQSAQRIREDSLLRETPLNKDVIKLTSEFF